MGSADLKNDIDQKPMFDNQDGWNEKQLQKELQNRRDILTWMIKNNFRSYSDVGDIVADYKKDPIGLLKRVKEDKK